MRWKRYDASRESPETWLTFAAQSPNSGKRKLQKSSVIIIIIIILFIF